MQGFDSNIGKYTSLAYLEAEKEAFWARWPALRGRAPGSWPAPATGVGAHWCS